MSELPGGLLLGTLGAGTVALTSAYLTRLYLQVFGGQRSPFDSGRQATREDGGPILFPLVALALVGFAVLFVVALPDPVGNVFFGVERSNSLYHYLSPVLSEGEHAFGRLAVVGALVPTVVGFVATSALQTRTQALGSGWRLPIARTVRWVGGGYGLDAAYDAIVVAPLRAVSHGLARGVERGLFQLWLARGVARYTRGLAEWLARTWQPGLVQSYVLGMVVGGVLLIAYLLRDL